jgi:alkylation response protein AidB-like acyl-CoA dehydrogenase
MYRLSADQAALVQRLADLADREVAPNADRVDRDASFPPASIDALAREGFLGLTIPAEHGGMAQGPRVAAAALDTLAQRCASTAMVYLMHLCGVACYVAAPERAADQLRAAAAGRHLSTLAWSERGSRSHFWAPVSQARPNGAGVRLDAKKSFVTAAGEADGYVVATRWAQAQQPLESMLYLVLRDDAGLAVAATWEGMGLRGNASAPMTLDGVEVGPERALSEEGQGFQVMLGAVLPLFQTGSAAVSIGIAEAAVQATQGHLTAERFEHLGSTLADLPNLRARLAAMRVETDRARAHLASVLDALEQPDDATQLLVLEIKASAAQAAMAVTETAMRACGGAAFGSGLPLARLFRDARASDVMAPTTDVAQEFIGRALVGMELF